MKTKKAPVATRLDTSPVRLFGNAYRLKAGVVEVGAILLDGSIDPNSWSEYEGHDGPNADSVLRALGVSAIPELHELLGECSSCAGIFSGAELFYAFGDPLGLSPVGGDGEAHPYCTKCLASVRK